MEREAREALITFMRHNAEWFDVSPEVTTRFYNLLESLETEAYDRGWTAGKDDAYMEMDEGYY